MKRLMATLLAMALCAFLTTNLWAADPNPAPAAPAPTATEKVAPAEKAPVADAKLPTIDGLIALAAEKQKDVKDMTCDFKVTNDLAAMVGTVKAMGEDKVNMYADSKEKDAEGKETVTSSMHGVITGKVMYMEMTGKASQGRPMAMKLDFDEIEKLQKQLGMQLMDTKQMTPPDYRSYLKSQQALGWAVKVTGVDGDLVTVELTRESQMPAMVGGKTVAKQIDQISLKDGLLRSSKSYKDGKLESTSEYSNYKFNTGLKAEDFVFKPSPGVQVMDLAAQLGQQLKAMGGANGGAPPIPQAPAPSPMPTPKE